MKIVFSGSMGRAGVGGLAWMNMQYLAGFTELGHDVYYLEDCGAESWVYDFDAQGLTTELAYPASYVRESLELLGLQGKWMYRAGDASQGMSIEEMAAVCAEADVFIVHAVPISMWRREYSLPRRRIYIDVDPGFIQIDLLNGHRDLTATIERCEHVFTIAQRVGAADCPIPTAGRTWHKTLAPVSLSQWNTTPDTNATHFTTIMQWRGFRDVEYGGVVYGQKDREFPRFIGLPRLTKQKLQLAVSGTPPDDLARHGWEVVPGWKPSRTPASYRSFIRRSRAEFSVAKHGYVKMRGGWFSDRSVCYLASGRPILVQDTGLREWLPIGEGVLTFSDMTEAVAGIERINVDYDLHCRAARRIAEQYFACARVLPPLLETALG
jgi:hypothetical protein